MPEQQRIRQVVLLCPRPAPLTLPRSRMPTITLIDDYGMAYHLTSSDPEIVAQWLLEQFRKAVSQDSRQNWRMQVWPTMVPAGPDGRPEPDWPVSGADGGKMWELNKDMMQRLHAAVYDVLTHRRVGSSRYGPVTIPYGKKSAVAATVAFAGYAEKKAGDVSEARWCDYRDHPYKGGQEGTIMMGQTVRMPNGGMQATGQEVREICPECAAELGLNPDYKAPEPPSVRKALLETAAKKS
jgi:hypothetical protein